MTNAEHIAILQNELQNAGINLRYNKAAIAGAEIYLENCHPSEEKKAKLEVMQLETRRTYLTQLEAALTWAIEQLSEKAV